MKKYLRIGQIDTVDTLDGIGRKITLLPLGYHQSKIVDFKADYSYVEEGEFAKDFLNSTFGRKIYFNGKYIIGWFDE